MLIIFQNTYINIIFTYIYNSTNIYYFSTQKKIFSYFFIIHENLEKNQFLNNYIITN